MRWADGCQPSSLAKKRTDRGDTEDTKGEFEIKNISAYSALLPKN
jgi:hypothetical protein